MAETRLGAAVKNCFGVGGDSDIMPPMNVKRNVAVNDSLLAEARRLAGARTSSAAVNAALREYVGRRCGNGAGENEKSGKANGAGEKSGRKRGGVEDLVELGEYLRKAWREGGWDDSGYRALRGGKRLRMGEDDSG